MVMCLYTHIATPCIQSHAQKFEAIKYWKLWHVRTLASLVTDGLQSRDTDIITGLWKNVNLFITWDQLNKNC